MSDELDRRIREMAAEPDAGVRMCHEQGKTAVYLSDDGNSIVHHAPDGTVRHTPVPNVPEFDS